MCTGLPGLGIRWRQTEPRPRAAVVSAHQPAWAGRQAVAPSDLSVGPACDKLVQRGVGFDLVAEFFQARDR